MTDTDRIADLERRISEIEDDPIGAARRARATAEQERITEERAAAADQLARTEARIGELEEEIVAAKRAAEETEAAYSEARDRRDAANDRHGRLLYEETTLRGSAKALQGKISGLDETIHALRTGGVA